MALNDRRDSSEVTVTVRHRCPDFAFGSALGPGARDSLWWFRPEHGYVEIFAPSGWGQEQDRLVAAAVLVALGDLATERRRHLDELAELPG